jgi:hypothetical protein
MLEATNMTVLALVEKSDRPVLSLNQFILMLYFLVMSESVFRGRRGVKGLKLYIRVFEVGRRRVRKVVNKTYRIGDYGNYLSMMSELRKILWEVYVRRLSG